MIAIGLASIPEYARIVRGSVLSAREFLYVDAARVTGTPPWLIMGRHILPNVIAPVLVVATIGVGGAILSLAGLSFLGLGAQPPNPEWGVLVSDGRSRLQTLPGGSRPSPASSSRLRSWRSTSSATACATP